MDSFSPEYVNENHAGRIVGVVGTFFFLALALVSLRVYVRVIVVRAFGVDDALIIVVAVSIASSRASSSAARQNIADFGDAM
jgi:hypothetical protein